ncbi:autophagy protein [Pseudogymnoascus verrucosus]|uniref:Autophagy protein n=1 Tax=Pseudogymnoascus verrucosus TaxID=342668 RepID=A0A1B8GPY3_9PEZI|nr:autophagy protein [Pseudogymnoascus verrucosus]OBT97882.1 autophagy protein [Pseudogymnoascus verrucosus]
MNCQKCRAPLKLDSSLESLNPAAFNLLVGSAHEPPKALPPSRPAYPPERKALYDAASRSDAPATYKRTTPTNPGMSFVLLSSSEAAPPALSPPSTKRSSSPTSPTTPPTSTSHETERANRLFALLSARSDIDHPICTECTSLLLSSLSARLSASLRERDAYTAFLTHLHQTAPTPSSLAAAETSLSSARDAEEAATSSLLSLERTQTVLAAELASLSESAASLDAAEAEFWHSHNTFSTNLAAAQGTHASLSAAATHDARLLDLLQRTNVHNDSFPISHDGTFGTIAGLRLGRLAAHPVDWPEINAAWGHTLLLLATVAKALDVKVQGYEMQPLGSTSRIVAMRGGRKVVLELYTSGDLPLGLTFLHRRFDAAMVAFLACLKQVGEGVGGRAMPYKIDGDKIGGECIRLGVAQDDGWSSACKYVLTCCKFLLAHVSNAGLGRR